MIIFDRTWLILFLCDQVFRHSSICVNRFEVVLSRYNKTLAKRYIVFCIQIYKRSLTKLTCLCVKNRFLKSYNYSRCSIRINTQDVKIRLFIYCCVVRTWLPVHFSTLLQIYALYISFEVCSYLRRCLVLNVLKSLKLACWRLTRHVSFKRDRSQAANFFAKAHFAFGNSRNHRRKFHNFNIIPLLCLIFNCVQLAFWIA